MPTLEEILGSVETAGITLSYSTKTEKLVARPTSAVTPKIVTALKERREELIDTLRSEATPGWSDELARDLVEGALARVAKRYAQLSSEQKTCLPEANAELYDGMRNAGESGDVSAFRVALRAWELDRIRAMEMLSEE
jgi:hypothetical protein